MRKKVIVLVTLVVVVIFIILFTKKVKKRTAFKDYGCDEKCGEDCRCTIPVGGVVECRSYPRYWISGGDADARAQSNNDLLPFVELLLNYVTWGTLFDNTHKFLWVESKATPLSGHVRSRNTLQTLGLMEGVNYDWVDGSEFGTTNLNSYTAIGVASTNTGMLTSDELNALTARVTDIATFASHGGGIVAFGEVESSTTASPHNGFYYWLPVIVTSSPQINTSGFTATSEGSAFGLTSTFMNYRHDVIFTNYDTNVLFAAEEHDSDVTSLMSDPHITENVCLDRNSDF